MTIKRVDSRPPLGARITTMRTCVVVAVIAALSVLVGASSAFASVVRWRLNNAPLIETSVESKITGKVTVTDAKVPLVGSVSVECQVSGAGPVGPNAAGKISTLTLSSCVNKHSCGFLNPGAEAVHLAWNTELSAVESVVHDKALSGATGTPGIWFQCSWGQDTCTGTVDTTMTNTESGVTAAFDPSQKLNCSQGGSGSGTLEGSVSFSATSGRLSAEAETQPEWLLNGVPIVSPIAVTWSGRVQVGDKIPNFGQLTVSCEDTGSGTAGAAFAGEMSQWTFSNCTSTQCAGATLEAVHLSWATELFAEASGVGEGIVNSGKGAPAFKMVCSKIGIIDECPLPLAKMTNGSSTVTAEVDKEKRSCTVGSSGSGEVTGSQSIQDREGRTLNVS